MAMKCGDGYALDFDTNQTGCGGGLSAQAPKGGGHFHDEDIFDGVGGLPGIEVGVQEDLEIGGFFAGEDETLSVGSVGSGVSGGAGFAFRGFGTGGFEGVEARSEFAFIVVRSFVVLHFGDRIAGGGVGVMGNWFRIHVEWVVTGLGVMRVFW